MYEKEYAVVVLPLRASLASQTRGSQSLLFGVKSQPTCICVALFSILPRLIVLGVASVIVFTWDLTQLSFFVPHGTVLVAGLYPFVVGDVVKIVFAWIETRER